MVNTNPRRNSSCPGWRRGHGVAGCCRRRGRARCGYRIPVWAPHPGTAPSLSGVRPGSGAETDAAEHWRWRCSIQARGAMSFGDVFWLLPSLGQTRCPPGAAHRVPMFRRRGQRSAGCPLTSAPELALAGVKGGCCGDARMWDKAKVETLV